MTHTNLIKKILFVSLFLVSPLMVCADESDGPDAGDGALRPTFREMGVAPTRPAQLGKLREWVVGRGPFRDYTPGKDHLGDSPHSFKHAGPMQTVPLSDKRFMTPRQSEAVLKLPTDEKTFTFIIFGDRTSGVDEKLPVLAEAVRDVNRIEPDFAITVGDMVQGNCRTERWMEELVQYRRAMDELNCPWFPVSGNHDLYWRGPDPPENWHEASYEKYFGPLWYAFEHKNCWFIILSTNETDPETGTKSHTTPESNVMSDVQFQWLKETLQKAKGADRIFVFMHHPRWMRKNTAYGNVWDPVHKLLVETGNVAAVFAGHNHRITHEKRDNIEYMTLSVTGGRTSAAGVPNAGNTHNFFQVTVRKDRIGVTAIPVSAMLDPRELSLDTGNDIRRLHAKAFVASPTVLVGTDGRVDTSVSFSLTNTALRPIDVIAKLHSDDSRWEMTSHPWSFRLEPKQSHEISFSLKRAAGTVDTAFRVPFIRLNIGYRNEGKIVSLPVKEATIPLDLSAVLKQSKIEKQAVLRLTGFEDRLSLPSITTLSECGALTLETWFNAEKTEGTAFLVGKGVESDFALTLTDGVPQFHVPLEHYHRELSATSVKIEPQRWYHLAGVYDRQGIRLYLDGRLVAEELMQGKLETNDTPFQLGAETDRDGLHVYSFVGMLDSVRLSKVARYTAAFQPQRDFVYDSNTLMLLDMQRNVGRFVSLVESEELGILEGDARIQEN